MRVRGAGGHALTSPPARADNASAAGKSKAPDAISPLPGLRRAVTAGRGAVLRREHDAGLICWRPAPPRRTLAVEPKGALMAEIPEPFRALFSPESKALA